MELGVEELFSPRIQKHCLSLWCDGYYKHAAHEAMIQVEQALKEKGMVNEKRFGHTLITSLFKFGSNEKTIKLRVPLGDDLQEQAKTLFEGAFSYYRNYTAHDGSKVDKHTSLRIMILASELLDLIDASSLSFADLGGVDGLVKSGAFSDKRQLLHLLKLLNGRHLPDGEADGLRDEVYEMGLDDIHLDAILELDLVRYHEVEYTPSPEELREAWDKFPPPSTIGYFELTNLGYKVIEEIETGK
jgi:uncharacterized protein (TIGR02391 family)